MAVIPPLTGFWRTPRELYITPEVSEIQFSSSADILNQLYITPAISEIQFSSFVPTDTPPGGDDLPAGTYTVEIGSSLAALGTAPRGFTIFKYAGQFESDGSGHSTAVFVQAGSTAVYVDGTDFDTGVSTLADISGTINNAGQAGTYLIVAWETSGGRSYATLGATYYDGSGLAVNSSSPVEAVTILDAQLSTIEAFDDYAGNTVSITPSASGTVSLVVISEAGVTAEIQVFDF